MKTQMQCDKMGTSKGNLKRYRCPGCGYTLLFFKRTTEVQDLPLKCKRCGRIVNVNIPREPESQN